MKAEVLSMFSVSVFQTFIRVVNVDFLFRIHLNTSGSVSSGNFYVYTKNNISHSLIHYLLTSWWLLFPSHFL